MEEETFIETDIKRILTWSTVYFALIGLSITACALLVPDVKTCSEGVVLMWQRDTRYFTDWLPTSNLVAYSLCNCLGFIFVNHVTLKREDFLVS